MKAGLIFRNIVPWFPVLSLICCFGSASAERKFEVGTRVIYQRFNDVEVSEGSLTEGRYVIPSGSIFYQVAEKDRIGIEFSYLWGSYYDKGIGTELYTTSWSSYRTGLGYKRLVFDNRNPGEPIKALIGARLDYYRSYLTLNLDPNPQTVTFNNLGLAVNAEGRYSIFSFWGEYMFVRLSGGDKPKSPSAWDYRGTPNLNLYGFAFGMGLIFGI